MNEVEKGGEQLSLSGYPMSTLPAAARSRQIKEDYRRVDGIMPPIVKSLASLEMIEPC